MRGKKVLPAALLLLFLALLLVPAGAEAAKKKKKTAAAETRLEGFQVIDGNTYYYKKGKPVTSGWVTVKKNKKKTYYYFNKEGIMLTGKVSTRKKMYYFREDGSLDHIIKKKKKMIALTYDDGPSAYTPIIVSALKEAGGRATFFVVGERVSAYSSQMKEAFDAGCEIGNHSWDHSQLTSLSSYSVERQVVRTNEAVKEVIGVEPAVMRPPYGSSSTRTSEIIGMPLILWNVDTEDWRTRSTSATIACVKEEARDGAIILMHDIHRPTAEAASSIIRWLTARGYQLVTISEMADCRGGMIPGKKYYSFKK